MNRKLIKKGSDILPPSLRTLPPDDSDLYPFLHEKLTRADVEWLLVTSLRNQVKLFERVKDILLRNCSLQGAHLKRAMLDGAFLQGVLLDSAHLEGANLCGC